LGNIMRGWIVMKRFLKGMLAGVLLTLAGFATVLARTRVTARERMMMVGAWRLKNRARQIVQRAGGAARRAEEGAGVHPEQK